VEAPEGLWDRIEQRQTRERGWKLGWPAAAAAAAVLLATIVGAYRPQDLGRLAAHELQDFERDPRWAQFASRDRAQLRKWIFANTDIDLPIPDEGETLGVRLFQRGSVRMAAIAGRIASGATLLLVRKCETSEGRPSASPHSFQRLASTAGVDLLAWRTQENAYVLASTSAGAGCRLCHAR
jgi:hypothetical protein